MAAEARAAGAEPGHRLDRASRARRGRSASMLANLARRERPPAAPFAPGSVLIGCGGESTVTLGPEHEFGDGRPEPGGGARRRRSSSTGADVAAVFIDTDGSDGGTDHAGAISRRRDRRARRGRRARPRATRSLEHRSQVERWPRSSDAHRDRPDPHQRQRPVRDRDRRGGLMSDQSCGRTDDRARAGLQEVRRGDRGRRRLARDRGAASSSRCSVRAAAARRRRCG